MKSIFKTVGDFLCGSGAALIPAILVGTTLPLGAIAWAGGLAGLVVFQSLRQWESETPSLCVVYTFPSR